MIAVDTSALVAIGLIEPEREVVLAAIRDSRKALISTVSVVETKMVLFKGNDVAETDLRPVVAPT